ncbi:MAG: CapA family protein, partial [Candidatus Margulisiibacteriota bacterium]
MPKYFLELKLRHPYIQKINSIDELNSSQIILLPWNTINNNLKAIPITNNYYTKTNKGTIQVFSFRLSNDGYLDFLSNNIEITIGGTVVLARGVHKAIQRNNNIHFPWNGTRHLFEGSDINVINFKSPLVEDFSYPKSSWVLVGKKIYAKALQELNINVASIAGNHMGDAKESGFLETIQTLNQNNIIHVGGGINFKEAYQCKVIQKKSTRIGFLGFNNVMGSISKANKNKPGIAWLDKDALFSIETCKKNVDFLIVLVNWGTEYTHYPRNRERNYAHQMVDAGADLIIGDQAHWVQAHEKIKDSHVSYGLGNYIFDQHWSQKTTEGIIQKFTIYNSKLSSIKTIPIHLILTG